MGAIPGSGHERRGRPGPAAGRGEPARCPGAGQADGSHARPGRQRDDRAVGRPGHLAPGVRLRARRQQGQHPVHPARVGRPLPCVYYIHGGGMESMSASSACTAPGASLIAAQGVAVAMVDFRNCLTAVVRAGGRAVPGRPQRLRLRVEVAGGPRRRAGRRPGAHHRRRRERRRQPDPGHRPEAQARRRPRPDQRPLRALPLHRRELAAGRATRRPPRTTASCSTCTTTAARWPTGSRNSRPGTRWPGPSFATEDDVAGLSPR